MPHTESILSSRIRRLQSSLSETNTAPTTSGNLAKPPWPRSELTRRRNGRWRSLYIFDPSSGTLEGSIKVDVHYYEDGNVRLLTNKPVSGSIPSGSGAGVVKEISSTERKYQEELNKGFVSLSEGAFKGLRRQLPVTRQKIEWDRVTSYRLGQDIGGGSSRR